MYVLVQHVEIKDFVNMSQSVSFDLCVKNKYVKDT